MRIDSPLMTNAIITGSFSGSFVGVGNFTGLEADSVEYANVLNKPTLVSGSAQIDITATTGYTAFSSSIASDIAGLDGEYATDVELAAVSSSAAADIASNLSSINAIGTFTASLDTDLTTLSLPANTTISSFGASLVDDADASTAKTTLGLENVTNESKATMFTNAALTGVPTAPTAITSTDSTQIATTAFVQDRLAEIIDTAPAALDTLNELAAAIGDDPNISSSLATTISTKLAKASNLSDLTDAGAARTNLGLAIGSDVQQYNATLAAVAGGTYTGDDSITTVGTIGTGTWQGSSISTTYTAAKVTSIVAGTNISINQGTGAVTITNGITNNNQLTNGAGYTTYSANQTLNNNSNVHFEGLMVGQTSGATANTIRCVGDVVAYYSSDAQFKDNVQTLEGSLDKVKAIRGVRFDWNDKQDVHTGHDIGVIAQEVEAVLPELVHHREHNDSKAVDYVKLTAVLIEAVKELAAKVEELEKK